MNGMNNCNNTTNTKNYNINGTTNETIGHVFCMDSLHAPAGYFNRLDRVAQLFTG